MNYYSQKYEIETQEKLKSFFETQQALISDHVNAFWRAKTSKYTAVFYKTGKFLVQGADVTDIVKELEEYLCTGKIDTSVINKEPDVPEVRIGVDESGKGDFFGPLVIAGVLVDKVSTEVLKKVGVRDCKTVSDGQVHRLASIIKNNCPFSIVTIKPAKYNELYEKLKNLNLLLAWGHARAIENILEKQECTYALSDKFGDEKLIKNALMKNGRKITLEQKCKAESDLAVAAASIIARAQFLNSLNEFKIKYGLVLPKGCNDKVIEAAKALSARYGKDELSNVAKVHFKTFQQV